MARFGNTVARETTPGDEGSYRQSADGLWVNPFKHDLPLSFFFLPPFSLRSEPPPARELTPFYIQPQTEEGASLPLLPAHLSSFPALLSFSVDVVSAPTSYLLALASFLAPVIQEVKRNKELNTMGTEPFLPLFSVNLLAVLGTPPPPILHTLMCSA